jgi:fructose-1,6-bisphosphatase I
MTSTDASACAADGASIGCYLQDWASGATARESLASVIAALAQAGTALAAIIAHGPLSCPDFAAAADESEIDRRHLNAVAARLVMNALRKTTTAYVASDEESAILTLGGEFAVAVNPLDAAADVEADLTLATVFSIFAASPQGATASFFRKGTEQLAAGYILYGPHTAMLLSFGDGVAHFVLDPGTQKFRLVAENIRIAPKTRKIAINAANYRHWRAPVRAFIDDCAEGAAGPCGSDFNMRWIACLIGETHRIFMRGGVYLAPSERRPGYEKGRLRLLYEAFPIAMLVEQAGGAATDGAQRILSKNIETLDQRTPLVFGSAEKVARIADYHSDAQFHCAQAPLFAQRGLFNH